MIERVEKISDLLVILRRGWSQAENSVLSSDRRGGNLLSLVFPVLLHDFKQRKRALFGAFEANPVFNLQNHVVVFDALERFDAAAEYLPAAHGEHPDVGLTREFTVIYALGRHPLDRQFACSCHVVRVRFFHLPRKTKAGFKSVSYSLTYSSNAACKSSRFVTLAQNHRV